MGKEIIISISKPIDRETISLEQWQVKRERRRKRVAKRMAKRFPLFAVQFVSEEFKGYTTEQFESDIANAKLPKKRKGKSPMKRQGRYPIMQKALIDYSLTGEQKYLLEAQRLRKRMFKPFEIEYRLKKERRRMYFPSTSSYKLILELTAIKFTTWEELDEILEEKTRWIHVS